MNKLNDYLARVYGVLESSRHVLCEAELAEVEHLIKHGEPAEGMRTLAWIIVEGDKKVPRSVISGIRTSSEGLVDTIDMPANLDSQASEN
jgi:hypothetical protein